MWRNMAIALFTHGQITTTLPKARSLQPLVEKLITKAKRGDLAARRQVMRRLGDPYLIRSEDDPDLERNRYGELLDGPRLVRHLFEEIAPRYADRDGGYTRMIKLARPRLGDGADRCVLQLVGEEEVGPQVSGRYSRRREKAHRRMNFAAERRRGGGGGGGAPESEEASSGPLATAPPEADSDPASAPESFPEAGDERRED